MGKTLGDYATCESIEDYNKLSNKFVKISNVEKDEWLPLYYAANCKIIMSFMENEDKLKKDAYLDEAEIMINKIKELSPHNSEIFALEALMFTARLVVDPMARGQEYSLKSSTSANMSLAFNKNNPRAKYILLSNKIAYAKFFGKETIEECAEAKKLLENWNKYNETKNPLAPKWGKNLISEIVKECEE